MLAGCGKAPRPGGEVIRPDCYPENLTIKPESGKMTLMWDPNCDDSIMISGYNIYLRPKSIFERYGSAGLPRSIKPYNENPYPGDTDPDNEFETMIIEDANNGEEYFVSVRTVFPDGSVSKSSNEVAVIPRPEGEFSLAFRYSDTTDGFSFKLGNYVRADGELNDLYFFSKDGVDYIASPHRLNGFLRQTEFYSLGKTKDIYQYNHLELDIPAVEKMPIMLGESYLARTADGNYVMLRIEDIRGQDRERILRIKYIYQTIKDLMRF
nr:hypothetical protein [candidate division Zixibacteria bacterium]